MSRRWMDGQEIQTDESVDGFGLAGVLLAHAEQHPGTLVALTVQPLAPMHVRAREAKLAALNGCRRPA